MKSWLSWPLRNNPPAEPRDQQRSRSFPTFDRDSAYQRPQYSSTRSDELVLRKLGLCNVCMNIDFQGLSTNRKPKDRYEVRFGPLHGQPFSLTCSLCQILWRDILELAPETAPSHSVTFDFTPIHSTTTHRGKTSEVLIGVWYRGDSKYGHLVFSASPDDPASVEIKKRPPLKNYNCQQSYDIGRRWLRECLENHEHCPKNVDNLLPTRVIDIGNACQDPTLYIPTPGTRGKYAALSYCWGTDQAVTLTGERLHEQRSRVTFPLRTLPRTLRDAIVVTGQLGFRYIWIDALCIVQDSIGGQDWESESANMDNIYGNASITIAAAAACSTTEGIFSFPRDLRLSTCSIPYQLLGGQSGTVLVDAYPTVDSTQESLDTRAWALQEALISRRVLRYGSNQMSWKCNMLGENANGPLNIIAPRDKHEAWTSTVVDYTARSLTYNSDRLAALAGYAKLLALRRPYDEYIAGMWKSELLEQLVWYRKSKSDLEPRPHIYAPSWSWVSIDSAVSFSYWPEFYKSHCEINSISRTQPKQIRLNLHGYVKQMDYIKFFKQTDELATTNSIHRLQSNTRRGSEYPSVEVILDVSETFEAIEETTTPKLICLHITPMCGLILVSRVRDESETRLYERIGLATSTNFEEWFADITCGPYEDALVGII